MAAKKVNKILWITRGTACVDVSTPKFPATCTLLDASDLPLMLDGHNGWLAARYKPESDVLYVVRRVGGRNGKMQLLHRLILGLTDAKLQGDHKNGDGLDNRLQNLRIATNAQNSANARSHRGSTSKYRGVSWDKERKQWTASISIGTGGGRQSLGRFEVEKEAAIAYDRAAKKRYGSFANLNFPKVKRGK